MRWDEIKKKKSSYLKGRHYVKRIALKMTRLKQKTTIIKIRTKIKANKHLTQKPRKIGEGVNIPPPLSLSSPFPHHFLPISFFFYEDITHRIYSHISLPFPFSSFHLLPPHLVYIQFYIFRNKNK